MKFKLDTNIPIFDSKINYDGKLIFLGSCFSDEISSKFRNAGFHTFSNPFGTIFNPYSSAQHILNCLDDAFDYKIFESHQVFYSWNCSNLLQASSKKSLEEKLFLKQQDFKSKLSNASHLFVTFGSSFVYQLKLNQIIVANCHKQNPILFDKICLDIDFMSDVWSQVLRKLKSFNPDLKIVFTVSPVRHIKDGIIQNNRSKARLFEIISKLESDFQISYFPSYEIIVDELRDYRFFKEDLVHPSQMAVNYVWDTVKNTFFEEKIKKIVDHVEKLRKLDEHIILSSNEHQQIDFLNHKSKKISTFLKEHPNVNW